jgi:hypothetical protein
VHHLYYFLLKAQSPKGLPDRVPKHPGPGPPTQALMLPMVAMEQARNPPPMCYG